MRQLKAQGLTDTSSSKRDSYYIKRDFDQHYKYLDPNEQREFSYANEEYLQIMDKVIDIQFKQDKIRGTVPDINAPEDQPILKDAPDKTGLDMVMDAEGKIYEELEKEK